MDEKVLEQIFEKCADYFTTDVNSIKKIKEFGEGKSGNRVFMIEISDASDPRKNGRYVIKICNEESEEFFNEIVSTVQLSQESVDGIFFPEYITAGKVDKALFYIYGVAGSELNDSIQLSGKMSSGEYILEKISKTLLCGWNERFDNQKVSLIDCIRNMLGVKRLDPDGRLMNRINNLLGDALAPAYCYENNILPNPYFYLNNLHGPLGYDITAVMGKIHGDLNCNNIIINKNIINNDSEIYLIDYSHYKNRAFLFFDNAYLQINLLLTGKSASNVFAWYTDIAHIANRNEEGKKNRLVNNIFNGVFAFINKYQPNNKESCWLQYLGAQIAAGLNWMNKKGNDEIEQALCFLYASVYLKELLCVLKYQIEDETDVKLTLLGGDKERKIWEILNQFNTLDNRYLLLSSCGLNTIEKEKFEYFSEIRWEGIFHIVNTATDDIGIDFVPKVKKKYGIQYRVFPEEKELIKYELAPTWCTIQVPNSGNMKVWYRQSMQMQFGKLLHAILSIRENDPLFIILDTDERNSRIFEEIITDIQVYAGKATIQVVCLNGFNPNLEQDEYLKIENTDYGIKDVASCAAITMKKEESRKIWLPSKGREGGKREKVYLTDEEVNYVSIDFEIVSQISKWNDARGDLGEAFYHGAEPSWEDIAEHRDIDREDYVNGWKRDIEDRLTKLGGSEVKLINLFHRAGAGGTTLSRRILWDFHTLFPCLFMEKIGKETTERLKLIYDKTTLPLLVIAEIRAGSITQIAINNLRLELINKGIRALFVCISRVNDINIKHYSSNLYLTSELKMIMTPCECTEMYKAYSKMTDNEKAKKNLNMLTWGDSEDWEELRQPFFYGLFTFGEEYGSIGTFINKSMENMKSNAREAILVLAFITSYSQMGLKKTDLESILSEKEDIESILNNPLIIRKSVGYQVCHPVIAQHILTDELDLEKDALGLLTYAKKFIDLMTGIYKSDSKRLNDILEEIFTHREYYVDEERYKFSTIVMELADEGKKEIFEYLNKKLPENPHYYNHLARVYIYPNEREKHSKIDFGKAESITLKAIEKAELAENEGASIHHHLMGKIYTKECKFEVWHAKFRTPVSVIWDKIKPLFDDAELEFTKSMTKNNMEYGLIGKMELISGILHRFSKAKKSSIYAILEREPILKQSAVTMIEKMYRLSMEYSAKYGNENIAYRNAMKNFYEALGNIKAMGQMLSLKGLTFEERLSTRRALVTLEILDNSGGKSNIYNMSEDRLQKIFDLINSNIKESVEANHHDCLMWFQIYMRRRDLDFGKAYDFLMNWPDGDRNYYVCFYRYVIGFVLYYNNQLDALSVLKHLKQSGELARNLYGISSTSTRELVGINEEGIYLIPDNLDAPFGRLDSEEREQYRKNHCLFFTGQISDFDNAMVSIRFTLDDVHNFIAKIPAINDIGGMNVGDSVKFTLGFSYKEMRAWNVSKI